jgi:uncharacterized protein YecE (DUF72 family)
MPELRIGTCSWKYPSWEGLVYSRADGAGALEEYSRKYDTVEIDQWFWSLMPGGKVRLPDASDAERYRRSVPDGFRFTVKAPNSVTLTHAYSKNKGNPGPKNPHFLSADLFSEFLKILSPLRDVLGPILFQFEYLNRQKMVSQDAFERAFGAFARNLPGKFEYAVEIRNPNYLNGRFLGFLHGLNFFPVLLQGYWMPPIHEVFDKNRKLLNTFPKMVLRLHGQDREGIEKETGKEWNRIVHPRDDELAEVARMTAGLLDAGLDLYVNVNNHFEGSAPLTIQKLRELMPKHID